MAIHGTLTTMSVPDLLQFLATSRKTGTLKFSRGKIIKQIYFENGMIVGSQSNDPNEYFGQILIHYGKLDETQLQAAMEVQRTSGGRLGEILIAKGFLTEEAVTGALRIRTLDIIYDLFLWDQAQFEFYDNERLPDDLIRIEVEPNSICMEGIYRIDEWVRYRTLIPSDRAILELGPGWTSSLTMGKEVRQILYFVEKRMSVAEICYNMHASSFHVYAQLYELVNDGLARVVEEVPEPVALEKAELRAALNIGDLLTAARMELKEGKPDRALATIQKLLEREPKNTDAQTLLGEAEKEFVEKVYASEFSPKSIPRILVGPEAFTPEGIGPREGFVLSRINGEWDIGSILSICPFREADCLKMIKTLLNNGIIGF